MTAPRTIIEHDPECRDGDAATRTAWPRRVPRDPLVSNPLRFRVRCRARARRDDAQQAVTLRRTPIACHACRARSLRVRARRTRTLTKQGISQRRVPIAPHASCSPACPPPAWFVLRTQPQGRPQRCRGNCNVAAGTATLPGELQRCRGNCNVAGGATWTRDRASWRQTGTSPGAAVRWSEVTARTCKTARCVHVATEYVPGRAR